MSNWLAGFIGAVIGSALSLLMISIVLVTRQVEKENSIYREGFAEGHRIGLRKGKVLKIDAALYDELKARATGRVDVAPGNDEHTEFTLCCPMPFKSAKIVRSDEEPRIISCERVDKAPGFDSIRPSATGVADKREGVAHD